MFNSGCSSDFGLLFHVFFSFLALYPGSSPFLPLFAWVRSVLSLGGCRSLPLSVFFFSFGLPILFVAFCPYCPLPFFPFLHEVLGRFLPWFGVSPFRVSLPSSFVSPHLVPLGFVLPLLISAFSFGLFFVSLVRPLVLLVSPLGYSSSCSLLVPHSSSFSLHLVFFVPSCTTLHRRSSFWCLLPLLVGSGNFRRCPVLFLYLVLTSTFPVFQNFMRRLSPRSIRFLALFAYAPWRILLAFPEDLLLCTVRAL